MCGIFYLKSEYESTTHKQSWSGIMNSIQNLKARGPDRTEIRCFENQVFGFCRLAINSISKKGDQPFCLVKNDNKRISLIMNGEIYNHKELEKLYKLPNTTGSDCEVILHLYVKFGMALTIDKLDGVFAFVLVDGEDVYFGRDAIGVRPLFYRKSGQEIIVASLPQSLENYQSRFSASKQVPAGCYYHFNRDRLDLIRWYNLPRINNSLSDLHMEYHMYKNIRDILIKAVSKRLLSDRPIGCLLSGGLDSSLIVSILSRLISPKKLKTFSIGFNENATDIVAARKVARYLNTDHHEVIISMKEAFETIPEIVFQTGTYDITTIRASVGMYLICKWIKQNTDIKVLFSGEGADEIFCGYLYLHYAPSCEILEEESTRLVKELQFFDVLRSDRTVSCHGLELRVPFLDKKVIETALCIPGKFRHPKNRIEKYILRKSFEKDENKKSYIPKEILWRRKEGFSDGVGNVENPWYLEIQRKVEDLYNQDDFTKATELGLCEPVTKESIYYFHQYHNYYKDTEKPIPHHWMPKWQNTNDPSGRIMPAFSE